MAIWGEQPAVPQNDMGSGGKATLSSAILFGSVVALVGFFIAAAAFKLIDGVEAVELVSNLGMLFSPFPWKAILVAIGCGAIVVPFKYFGDKTVSPRMEGKEFGSAEWGDPKEICAKYADQKDMHNNRLLSENMRMSYDGRATRLNSNGIVLGGSGTGKTFFVMTPNLLNMHGSNVYTDPKGGLLDDMGNYLEAKGTVVRCINLVEMDKSDRFNPFEYIHKEADVAKLITNLIANTTPADASKGDPFWEKAESLYLQGIFSYVWLECPRVEVNKKTGKKETLTKTFRTVLKLLDEAEVKQKGDSDLTIRMNELAEKKGSEHPAVRSYFKCIRGAGDTVRSIIITANSRFAAFDNPELLNILDADDMHLPWIGAGWNNDGKTKTALFCIIPDDDSTFNFVPGMLYTLLFQELYAEARKHPHNMLPLDVGFWFDEFANISMPASFDKIVATCRSRAIYVTIVLQSLAQIKKIYEKDYEGIIGNCDTLTYLGGNEEGTHKYMSESLGKATITKSSSSVSKGKSGSSSQSTDRLGRELMTKDEVRVLPNDECIVLVRGCKPVRDFKIKTDKMDEFNRAMALGRYFDREHDEKHRLTQKDLDAIKIKGGKAKTKDAGIFAKAAAAVSGFLENKGIKKDKVATDYVDDETYLAMGAEISDAEVFGDNEGDDDPFGAGTSEAEGQGSLPDPDKDDFDYAPGTYRLGSSDSGFEFMLYQGELYCLDKSNGNYLNKAKNMPVLADNIADAVLSVENWTDTQIFQIRDGLARGLEENEVLLYVRPELPANVMEQVKLRLIERIGQEAAQM